MLVIGRRERLRMPTFDWTFVARAGVN